MINVQVNVNVVGIREMNYKYYILEGEGYHPYLYKVIAGTYNVVENYSILLKEKGSLFSVGYYSVGMFKSDLISISEEEYNTNMMLLELSK
jgi:hypothetical protein